MKHCLTAILVFVGCLQLLGQEKAIKVSEKLTLTQLNERTYIHTVDYSNGLVYVVEKDAIIISTPPTDSATLELVDYIENKLKAKVIACIVDHWHYDAMEGIDILHQKNIPTYSYSLTQKIAKDKGLPMPKNAFEDSLSIAIGDKKVEARYFGPSHSADDIVIWLPDEQILFGSCGVKSKGGWVGNIADAHLWEWKPTIKKVRAAYPNVKIVVPGHGKHGDYSLLYNTMQIFDLPNKEVIERVVLKDKDLISTNNWQYKVSNYDSMVTENTTTLFNGAVMFNKDSVLVWVTSPKIIIDSVSNTFTAQEGQMSLLNKRSAVIIAEFGFKNLTLIMPKDKPHMSIVIKEFVFD